VQLQASRSGDNTVDATALRRKAGAVTWDITVESWTTLKVSVIFEPNSIARPNV
jgi:hypothetical protein